MSTLKSIVRRSTALGAAFALLVGAIIPAVPVYADALNPLTDRSLTLSSGSPGWLFTDGSGNSTYAPPNSGANGQKTGNTFDFKVSSTDTVYGMSFQYCTTSAGDCYGPGDNLCSTGTTGGGDCVRKTNAESLTDDDQKSDLEIVVDSNQSEATFGTYVTDANVATNPDGVVSTIPAPASTGTNYMVYYLEGSTWTASTGWTMAVANTQDGTEGDGNDTDKNNQINLTNAGGLALDAGERVRVVFFGTDTNYITNPGSDEFFVKINTWNTVTTGNWTPGDMDYNIDGGVTVANVMNESIQITTKVLETMDFSVGTVDPYTLEALPDLGGDEDENSELFAANGNVVHGVCDPILPGMLPTDPRNTLQMGDANAEFSLETDDTYITHSYWRLSSNSSAGATVYYSGVTLSNTVNDQIDAIGATAAAPLPGSEQFGIALANDTAGVRAVDYGVERDPGFVFEHGADNTTSGVHASVTDDGISNVDSNPSWHSPQLATMVPTANYDAGAGTVNNEGTYGAIDTQFAFDPTSNTIPVAIAEETTNVIDCVTGKMRYIANIAATTPAGIYTTKINYIAAPQY